jgi:hypothetical protein
MMQTPRTYQYRLLRKPFADAVRVEHMAALGQLADHHPRRHGLHADQARLPAVVSAVSMELREYDSSGQPKHGKVV